MQISSNTYNPYINQNISAIKNAPSDISIKENINNTTKIEDVSAQPKNNPSKALVSDTVKNALLRLQEASTNSKYTMSTDKGNTDIDLGSGLIKSTK